MRQPPTLARLLPGSPADCREACNSGRLRQCPPHTRDGREPGVRQRAIGSRSLLHPCNAAAALGLSLSLRGSGQPSRLNVSNSSISDTSSRPGSLLPLPVATATVLGFLT